MWGRELLGLMHPVRQLMHGDEGKAPRSSSPSSIICLLTEPNHRKLWKLLIMGTGHATQPTSPGVSSMQGQGPVGC